MSETGLIPLQAMAIAPTSASPVVPAIVAAAGDNAARRFLEFFAVTIENPNTRQAYFHACRRFFAWCEHKKLDELVAIEPLHVAAYIEALGKDFEKPPVKQHLAAIRMLFDWLVTGQVVATNPAHSVRGRKARRQDRQDHGFGCRPGPEAVGQHQYLDRRRAARPGAD